MTESDPTQLSAEAQHIVLHRRTWELELLISGAIVVALFQIPGAVDGLLEGLRNHVSRDLFDVVWSIYYPIKLAINPTIIVFVIHILLRGFWVGLVGLNAVFPDGIDWSKVNMGPIARGFQQRRTDPQKLEDQVDRAASLLFAVLFSLLALISALALWLSIGMAVVLFIASLPGTTTPIHTIWLRVYVGILVLLTLPGVLAGLIDKSCERWPALARRLPFLVPLCRALLFVGGILMLTRLWFPGTVTMASNFASKKPKTWQVILVTVPASVLLSSLVLVSMLGGPLYRSMDSYVFAPPRPMESGMSTRHYMSFRTPGDAIEVPTIQSDIVSDAYLRLYLPYDAWRDNDRLSELCPDIEPFRRDGDLRAALLEPATDAVHRRSTLACFNSLWQARLNGEALPLELVFADEPGGRGRGVMAHIPTAGLPRGRNELTLTRHVSEREKERPRFNPEKHTFHIPFWL